MQVVWKVTQSDILSGEPAGPCNCALALAGTRLLKRGYEMVVIVPEAYIRVAGDKAHNLHELTLPEEACELAYRFDRYGNDDEAVEPLAFEVDIPKKYLKTARRLADG